MDEAARKDALLAALLPDVPFDGWTWEAMRAAARRIDMAEDELLALFPDGPRALVEWFSHWADRLTLETMASRPTRRDEARGAHRRGRGDAACAARPASRGGAARAGFLALPQNAALGARLLYDTVDALWYAAGDTATDFSFYTKRGMLAGIYAATTLFWLDDRSLDGAATEAFLERRLAEVTVLPRLKARIDRVAALLPNPARFFRLAPPPSSRGLASGSSGTASTCALRKASSAAATAGSASARIAAAKSAALTAPARPMASVPTGTPPQASGPSRRGAACNPINAPGSGTPSTGRA